MHPPSVASTALALCPSPPTSFLKNPSMHCDSGLCIHRNSCHSRRDESCTGSLPRIAWHSLDILPPSSTVMQGKAPSLQPASTSSLSPANAHCSLKPPTPRHLCPLWVLPVATQQPLHMDTKFTVTETAVPIFNHCPFFPVGGGSCKDAEALKRSLPSPQG